MKLMLVEWHAYMQHDLEEALKRLQIDFRVFFYPFDHDMFYKDDYFEQHFLEVIRGGDYDAVMSFNFLSPVSNCCFKLHIPYLSWVYDGGLGYRISREVIAHPTNYIFLFDRYEVTKTRKAGIENTFHLPLAVNESRLDSVKLSEVDKEWHSADVSFVGNLYPSVFSLVNEKLSPFEQGVLDSIVETQLKVYGTYYLDHFVRSLSPVFANMANYGEFEDDGSKNEKLQSLICKEIARRERLTILYLLSQEYRVALYSAGTDVMLDRVEYRGMVDCTNEIYKVYKASKINLNVSYRRIVTGIPLRCMDIMGAGGFLLTNFQAELTEYFVPDVDCVLYESYTDAIEKVRFYLEHEEKRKEIAHNGYRAVRRFSFEQQLKEMIWIALGKKI